jgi:hypothetical protein
MEETNQGANCMDESIRKMVEEAKESLAAAEKLGITEPEPLNELIQKMGRLSGTYPIPHLAVEVCCSSYLSATQPLRGKNISDENIARAGQIAYCTAMPRLADPESIREYIACVVHGMGIGAIPTAEGTRLLYGAQVAHSAQPSPKRRKKRNKSAQNTPGNQPPTPTPSIT